MLIDLMKCNAMKLRCISKSVNMVELFLSSLINSKSLLNIKTIRF